MKRYISTVLWVLLFAVGSPSDVEKEFKQLHDNGFNSCDISCSSKRCAPKLAKQIKAASAKYSIPVTTVVGVPGSKSRWYFSETPSSSSVL